MLSVGSVVAGYRIEGLVGAGGMGEVYLASHPSLPRYDALKVLSAELSRDPDFRGRFVREADVAARLDHPNIVSIHNRGQTDEGQLWIAMQYVDGTDADKALVAGAMTPARAVYIITEVAKALDYAGARDVVHRDVKPANFLLAGPVGPEERVLLGDFGIARALGDAGFTVTGSVMGTLSYAAPEVLSGMPFDPRADLYSLGCTLFRLLTGKAPFGWAEGMAAVVAAHLQAPAPKVSDWAAGLSPRMDAVIAKAMAKDPAQRFGSCRELAAAAGEALADRSVSITAPWQPIASAEVNSYPATLTPSQPQWWLVDAARTSMASPPTYPVHGVPGWWEPPPQLPPRRRRALRGAAVAAGVVVLAAAATTAVVMKSRPDHQGTTSPTSPRAPAPSGAPSSGAPSSSATTTAGPATPLPASALPGLLLAADQVATLLGAPTMQVVESTHEGFPDGAAYLSDKDCAAPYQPGDQATYAHAGWNGSVFQFLRNQSGPEAVQQAIIGFPTAEAAQKVFSDERQAWAACSGRAFTLTFPNEAPKRWNFGSLNSSDDKLLMTASWEHATYMGCQRGLTVRGNIIVDVGACDANIDKKASDILDAITAKIH